MDVDPNSHGAPSAEHTRPPLEVTFIDETHSANPFTVSLDELKQRLHHLKLKRSIDVIAPIADPAFHQNDERLQMAGARMARIFDLAERGNVLDVGTGSNFAVGRGIRNATGRSIHYLDVIFGNEDGSNPDHTITHGASDGPQAETYAGKLQDIDDAHSVLKSQQYGAIVFNGSWTAGGNNNTVTEMLDGDYHGNQNQDAPVETSQQFRERAVHEMIQTARDHLTHNGVIVMTSSRFARIGAGYNFDRLPEEKLMFLDAIRHAQELGAKTIQVVGVSSDGLRRVIHEIDALPDVQKHLEINASLDRWFDPFGRLKYHVQNADEHEYSATELKELIENNDIFRRELDETLGNPINLLAEQQRITHQLTGPVQNLSATNSGVLSNESVQKTKDAAAEYFPKDIAMIDAIAIGF